MSMGKQILKGHYLFEDGKFLPREDMELIDHKLKGMKMLAGSTEIGEGEFYFDPTDCSYWHYVQYEDYRTEMRPVTKEFITTNYPTVDCNKLLDIPRK